jgi:putative proteasome-type protease
MTYCVAMRLASGLIFASDSRTNGGVDNVSSFSKMTIFEKPGERTVVLLSSGNLATTQSVISLLRQRNAADKGPTISKAETGYEIAEIVGATLREVIKRDVSGFKDESTLSACFIVGGQVKKESPRLFKVYAEGNFIEATEETNYFQIGESKYGKPIIDRTITYNTELTDAAKCILVSFDSTIRSNVSVGLPIDMAYFKNNDLKIRLHRRIEQGDKYFDQLRQQWSKGMRQLFARMPDPNWPSE